jgi:SNF2 family DNA or RNA helicase
VTLADPRRLTTAQRHAAADRVRTLNVPHREFRYFNSSPCREHAELAQGCLRCGIRLRRHQRTGTAWMWVRGQGLLGDSVGLGKTAQVAAVIALGKETGELGYGNRTVVVCRAAAVRQWAAELRRLLPEVQVITADGTPGERLRAYLGAWEVCVISDRTLSPAGRAGQPGARDGDVERLRELPVGMVVFDDIDAMRNGSTKTAYAVKRLAANADRVYGVHGTPLQKRLKELYYFLEPVGGREVLGTVAAFTQRYVSKSRKILWVRDKRDPTGRRRKKVVVWLDTGVKQDRLPEFKRLVAPMILRRTVDDLDDVELPAAQVNNVWLDLLPQQQARMDELKAGTLRRLRERGAEITQVEAGAAFTRGRQINSGLAALDDANDVSVKLDWVTDMVTGDLSGGKVVIFIYFKPNIAAMSARLEAAGVGHVLMWSTESKAAVRAERIDRFWNDPDCQVLVGSPTIEASLNLQVAGHLIAADQLWNPQRMNQLLGRVQRQGSRHQMVVFHQLLINGTLDEDFLPLMESEQALADSVWDDTGEIYSRASPRRLMQMVARTG